jgi:tetratricopeptide (TPR) repeat protein
VSQPKLAAVIAALVLGVAVRASADDGARAREAFSRGLAAAEQADHASARAAFREAVQAAPEWPLALVHLGIAMQAQNPDAADTIAVLERAVTLDPKNPRGHLHLGVSYEAARRYDDAIVQLRAALELRPDLRQARYHLAAVLGETGPAADAILVYEEVLRDEPTHVGALAAVADLYENSGQPQRAEVALLAITRLHPAIPYHQYRLAQFYQRTGDGKKAERIYAKLAERDPPRKKMRQLR